MALIGMQFFPFFGIAFGAMILLPIIWLIIGILIAIWVYRDAEERGESGVLWLLVVLLTSIIGLIVWLIVRPEKKETKRKSRYCPECGSEIDPGAKYCDKCGHELN